MENFGDKYLIDTNDPDYHRKLGTNIIEEVIKASKGDAVGFPLVLYDEHYYRMIIYDADLFDASLTSKGKNKEQDK